MISLNVTFSNTPYEEKEEINFSPTMPEPSKSLWDSMWKTSIIGHVFIQTIFCVWGVEGIKFSFDNKYDQ